MLLNLFEYPIGYMEFRAGEEIALLPGFRAMNGSRFWAHIEDFEPCDYTLEELMTDDEVPYSIVSIDEDEEKTIKYYPNPVRDYLIMETENMQIQNMQCFNLQGQNLKLNYDAQSGKQVLELRSFQKGIYVLRIQDSEGNINTIKFIKL